MTLADEARDNSIQCEMVKYAYRQTKDGVVVSFVVHPNDIPAGLSTSHIGARYVAVLVQIGDDERPIKVAGAAAPAAGRSMANGKRAEQGNQGGRHVLAPNDSHSQKEASQDEPAPEKPRRDWRALPKPQQAGIRINEPAFAVYLKEEHPHDWRETGEVDACLKFMCGITSKRELATDARAGALWFQIDSGYQVWLAKERVGA